MSDPIQYHDTEKEAMMLAVEGTSHRLPDLAALAQSFLHRRMANANTMERAKLQALNLLLDKMENEPDKISATKLLEIIETISTHTGSDLKTIMDTQVALANAGGKSGSNQPAPGLMTGLFGGGQSTPAQPVHPVSRETYKLLDGLNQVAENVVARAQSGVVEAGT